MDHRGLRRSCGPHHAAPPSASTTNWKRSGVTSLSPSSSRPARRHPWSSRGRRGLDEDDGTCQAQEGFWQKVTAAKKAATTAPTQGSGRSLLKGCCQKAIGCPRSPTTKAAAHNQGSCSQKLPPKGSHQDRGCEKGCWPKGSGQKGSSAPSKGLVNAPAKKKAPVAVKKVAVKRVAAKSACPQDSALILG